MEKFGIEEKKALVKAVENVDPKWVKDEFYCDILNVNVKRIALSVEGVYAGRDLIIVRGSGELKVTHASPYYVLVQNEDAIRIVREGIKESAEMVKETVKKESISEVSVKFDIRREEKEVAVIIRNGYVPGQALSIGLYVPTKYAYIPAFKIRRIHTEILLRKEKIPMNKPITEVVSLIPKIKELDEIPVSEADEEFLERIEETSYYYYRVLGGEKVKVVKELGKEVLKEAFDQEWSVLQLIGEFLKRGYERGTTVKRKVENVIFDNLPLLLNSSATTV